MAPSPVSISNGSYRRISLRVLRGKVIEMQANSNSHFEFSKIFTTLSVTLTWERRKVNVIYTSVSFLK